ncbi:hypothetical protein LIER_28533 [Lithospermum erythrorhizon]|uniref:PB1 domain-containing protein n=1 Tax=Lithospermum erythrorhizon TaxID=34254 RepID=A0AAV3RH64_LITER
MVGPSINSPNFTMKLSSSSTIKFLCSYGGKILPRYQDGKLRYNGGQTRVLAVERSIPFRKLLLKLGEICGESVSSFRCQLPTEDLDALVTITSDEDLSNIIEEYDKLASSSPPSSLASIKIRVFIYVPKRLSPTTSLFPTTSMHATTSSSSSSSFRSNGSTSPPISMHSSTSINNLMSTKSVNLRNQRLSCCHMSASRPGIFPMYYNKAAGKVLQCACPAYGNIRRQIYLVHNGNYWQ